MRGTIKIPVSNSNSLAVQLTRWAKKERYDIVLQSNGYDYKNGFQNSLRKYDVLAAFGAEEVICPEQDSLNQLKPELNRHDWLFGYLGYDLKNELENLTSSNFDGLHFSNLLFFRPQVVFAVSEKTLSIHYLKNRYNRQTAGSLYDAIMAAPQIDGNNDTQIKVESQFTKDEYLSTISGVLQHIQRGDIYEMNLCQEFYANNCKINPYETYNSLNAISPTPFSAFGKFYDKFLLCASPERYITRSAEKVISQPIKGTCKRGSTEGENLKLIEGLKNDPKERSENVMIVDLVRNDLSRIAVKGSVNVDELCGVYPFKQVNQMVSTISCSVNNDVNFVDIIRATFPMGSMTGAPKVSAMKLIEKYERTKRGIFSGAVGYVDPQGNFDFNVVIRSLLYNKKRRYLSFTVGGAITSQSNPENEYNECLLKANAIEQVLTSK